MIEWILTSSILILIITAVRFFLKGRISLRLQYALWGLVLLRLLIPVTLFHSGISVLNAAPEQAIAQAQAQLSAPITYIGSTPAPTQPPDWEPAKTDTAFQPATSAAQTETGHAVTLAAILTGLWLAGVGIVAVILLVSNLRYSIKLRKSRKPLPISCKLPVYVTPVVEAPCLFGLLRPAVYFPTEAAQDTSALPHILAHEQTHCRHGDHIWAFARCVCLALHWYNPFVWLAASLSRQDAELACDEATIAALGEDQRADYGKTLIRMTCVQRGVEGLILTATTMKGNKKEIKERIVMIAKKPKTALYTLIAVVLVAAIAVGCTFTGSVDTTVPEDPTPSALPATEPTASEAATEPPASIAETQPLAESAPTGDTDALSAVLSALSQQSIFYSSDGGMAFYSSVNMEKVLAGTAGVYHYGKSVLYGTTLLFAYLPDQQSEILTKLQSIDASTLEPVELSAVQETMLETPSLQFSTYIENPDGDSYCLDVYALLPDGAESPTEVIIQASAFDFAASAYYRGTYDKAAYGGLADMLTECRASTERLDDTAIVTFPGEAAEKWLSRWENVKFVNMIDGAVQDEPVQPADDFDETAYDAKVVIQGDEYFLYTEAGLVSFGSNTYPLNSMVLQYLTMLRMQ